MAATAWSREGGTVRLALALLIPLSAAVLQGTLAPLVAIGDARPSLPIVVAGSWAVAVGAQEAVWWAFLGGLASDLLSGGPLGAFALASLPPIAAIGIGDRGAFRSTGVLVGAFLVGLAALVALLIYVGILVATSQPVGSVPLALGAAGASAVYSGVLALGIYPLARLLRRVTEKQGALGVW